MDHTASHDHCHHVFRARTKKDFTQFKAAATAEADGVWAKAVVTYVWRERVLEVSALGMHGNVRLIENGDHNLVIAELHLTGWPATLPWIKTRIVSDTIHMTERIVGTR